MTKPTKQTGKPRAFRRYRGVAIFREQEKIPGSDFALTNDFKLVPRAAQYDVHYRYAGGYKCSSVAECKQDIDDLLLKAAAFGAEKQMVETLNEE